MMKKLISAAVMSLIVALALVACGGSSTSTAAPAADAGAKDGEYTATAPSDIGGEISVTIKVAGGKIESATVDVSSQTVGFGADHEADYEEMIVTANGAELDNISGVTLTTDAIKTAYADVLSQAGLG